VVSWTPAEWIADPTSSVSYASFKKSVSAVNICDIERESRILGAIFEKRRMQFLDPAQQFLDQNIKPEMGSSRHHKESGGKRLRWDFALTEFSVEAPNSSGQTHVYPG
jgi:hypothetical protein